ncbi:MAG: hypothetical protein JXM70_11765 [Pirellulales bacterium]|nr:hypothetical protein [Pirellulales bacterium]
MSNQHAISRRRFLLETSALGAATIAAPTLIPRSALASANSPGANERVIIGFIGTGGRSRQLMDHVPEGGRIVAISDCYTRRMTETLQQKKADWKTYQHYEKMIDAENLDEIGHRSISVCHLTNIAHLFGRRLRWNPEQEQYIDDVEANTYLARPRRKGYELPDA